MAMHVMETTMERCCVEKYDRSTVKC